MPSKRSFRVLHVSGQDENHKAIELNAHSPTTKGWQSSRFCLYPQDIVVQLDRRSRLRKIQILSHQTLIATKIEFYVGDVPEGTNPTLQNARYTRLGYVALSNNEKTQYKARELKSVHVDAVGTFVKFVIHKNHINKHNLYNQVGIIALNVIGDEVSRDEADLPDVGGDLTDDAAYNRPDYISPLDDLAFDMYQDPEVAQMIRKLERKKQEAVMQERYDYAKKLKVTISDLQKAGEKLGKFEVSKRQAVENEDYDKAKLKKVQMDEYRLQVYQELAVHDLMESTGSRYPMSETETRGRGTPTRLDELPGQGSHTARGDPPRTPYEDRPLPAIKNKSNRPPPESREETPVPEAPPQPASKEWDRPIPMNSKGGGGGFEDELPPEDASELPVSDETTEPVIGTVVDGCLSYRDVLRTWNASAPDTMSEKDQRQAAFVIDVFGESLVTKSYSKTWSHKEEALQEVERRMRAREPGEPGDSTPFDARATLRAAVFLINRGLKDKVFAVFKAALNLLQMILTEYIPANKIPKSETSYAVDKTLPNLILKTGDTAARARDQAKAFILEESSFPEVKPLNAVTVECVRPFKGHVAPRLALSRTEMVETLYKQHQLSGGLTLENMMKFCTQALQHTAGEVREKAERIIIMLYKDHHDPVKKFLPVDDERTRKNVLYKQLFEAFDKIDGKPSKEQLKRMEREQNEAKEKEINALQNQLQQLKDMTSGKAPVDETLLRDDKANKDKKGAKNKKPSGGRKAEEEEEKPAEDYQIENTCIFCNDKNESYTEEGLDLHYWKSCPMLKRCSHCKQVVEISGLTEHLLTECEAHGNFGKCPRCTEAIPTAHLDQHIKDKACTVADPERSHCPLCHINFNDTEDGWKDHLMGRDGCKNNPRRLPALGDKGKGVVKGGKTKVGVKGVRR